MAPTLRESLPEMLVINKFSKSTIDCITPSTPVSGLLYSAINSYESWACHSAQAKYYATTLQSGVWWNYRCKPLDTLAPTMVKESQQPLGRSTSSFLGRAPSPEEDQFHPAICKFSSSHWKLAPPINSIPTVSLVYRSEEKGNLVFTTHQELFVSSVLMCCKLPLSSLSWKPQYKLLTQKV